MDRDTADIAIRIGMLLLGAVGSWKLIIEFSRTGRAHLRDEYKFAREFFKDLAEMPDMHPFLKQKGYQAIVGESSVSAQETEYLLALHDPAKAVRNYLQGRRYLEFLSTSTGAKLEFKPKYKRKWSRDWRKVIWATLYFVCYSVGVSPLVLPGFKLLSPVLMPFAFMVTATIFFPAGFFALTAGIRISRAEELLGRQYKHGNVIIHIVEKEVA